MSKQKQFLNRKRNLICTKLMMPTLAFCLVFSFVGLAFAQGAGSNGTGAEAAPTASATTQQNWLEGVVLEKGTKKPMSDVNVFVLPQKLKATTTPKGEFRIEGIEPGAIQIIINVPDYQRLEINETFPAGGTKQQSPSQAASSRKRRFFIERESYSGLETVVYGKAVKRDDTTRTMTTEQFISMPGSGGDPVKAIQNLPGVARPPGGSANVIIQGSAPKDTSYKIEDHGVPLVFHFGGLTSVVIPEAVEQIDYLSAGYGPEYGNALGGIIGLKMRNPATDLRKGFFFADTTKAGGLIEGPIDNKSSFLIGGRYSYIGYVLKAVLKDNDQLDLTVAPSFADLTGVYERRISAKDKFRLTSIGSRDELEFLFKEPLKADPALRGSFRSLTQFVRVIPQWTHIHDDEMTSKLSLGLGKDQIDVNVGDIFFKLDSTVITSRGEIEYKLGRYWTTYFGFDNEYNHYNVRLKLPTRTDSGGVDNPISTGVLQEREVIGDNFQIGPYFRNTVKFPDSAWTLSPGMRTDYFSSTKEFKAAPRLSGRYDFDSTFYYRAATGLYFQPPEPQESDGGVGNPDVKAPSAYHFATGVEKDFRNQSGRGFVVGPGVFYRLYQDLVVASSDLVTRNGVLVPERFNNKGKGNSYGLELSLKYDAKPWSWFLSYTLSRSNRQEPGQDEYLFEYDQTHNINVVGQIDLKSNWKLSGRARYVTGNPTTPIVGATFDADNDVYIPKRGAFYSERLEPFTQLDFRVDKKWILNDAIWSAYLDVQNITSQKNSEGIRYSYDYSQKTKVSGLPILPTLGVRGEF